MNNELLMSRGNLEDIMTRLNGCRALLGVLYENAGAGISETPEAALGGMCDLLECICRDFQADIECAELQAEKEDAGMIGLGDQIAQFIEDARDADGAQSFVWLPDRGVMVHLDTCTDLALVSAAAEQLNAELDETAAMLAKVSRLEQELENAADVQ